MPAAPKNTTAVPNPATAAVSLWRTMTSTSSVLMPNAIR